MDQWIKNPLVYEINTMVWTGELSEKYGRLITLADVPVDEWDEIAGLGVDAVWLMGVWQRSDAGRAVALQNSSNLADFGRALPGFSFSDVAGSPYCVRDYTADERFGGDLGLGEARNQLALRGIKLILDFVPNHLAPDHRWISRYPEFFIRGDEEDLIRDPVTFCRIGDNIFACGKDPHYPAWQDVIQTNAFHPGYRDAVIEALCDMTRQCDGVRCDMAMLMVSRIFEKTWGSKSGTSPGSDFWEQIIPAVRSVCPGFLFMGEVYWDMEWELLQQGFDYCYDKRLYDRFRSSEAWEILQHLNADIRYQERMVRFLENHDEDRAASVFSIEKHKAVAVSCFSLPGARMLHEGQCEGRMTRLPVFLTRRPFEAVNPEIREFYFKLIRFAGSRLLRFGNWSRCECYGWPDNHNFRYLMAWQWQGESDCMLIVVNFREQESQGLVRFIPVCHDVTEWYFDDLFTGSRYVRSREELMAQGLYAGLPGWGFHFFKVTAG